MNLFSEASLPVSFWTPPLCCWGFHLSYGFDLHGDSLDAPFCDQAPQQLPAPYAKNTLFLVQFEPVVPEVGEGLAKVLNVIFVLLASHDKVIDVR